MKKPKTEFEKLTPSQQKALHMLLDGPHVAIGGGKAKTPQQIDFHTANDLVKKGFARLQGVRKDGDSRPANKIFEGDTVEITPEGAHEVQVAEDTTTLP